MSLTRSNEVSDSPLQRKSSSILLLFRGKGVLRLCRTTTAISCAIASLQDTQSFLMKKRPRGCSFFPKASMRRIWSVRQPPSMNTRALRSTGAYRLSGEAPRPLQKTALQSPMFPGDAESGAKRNEQRGSPRVHPPDPVGSGGWPEGDLREPSLFNLTC